MPYKMSSTCVCYYARTPFDVLSKPKESLVEFYDTCPPEKLLIVYNASSHAFCFDRDCVRLITQVLLAPPVA
jgi:hypothetical protein